jgi:SOS response regulatory protein OraA/RecX
MSALRMLERRPHATAEVARKLKMKGYTAGVVRAVTGRLAGAGLLDDGKFASGFAAWQLAGKAQGKRLLAARLMARGIRREMAEEAAASALSGRDEAEMAREEALRAARRYAVREAGRSRPGRRKAPERDRLRALVWAHLARRGFGSGSITKAMRGLNLDDDGERD